MKRTLIFILLLAGLGNNINAQPDLTADDILNKSIEFCGGIGNLSKIKSSNLVYSVSAGDSTNISVVIKREISYKYMRSTLSESHVATSMHYNGSTVTVIEAEEKEIVTDINAIDEIKLQTFNQPQYGYKKLSYSMERLDDQKFDHFDCYVLRATAKNGYSTINYFDKKDFRLIMIIYPKGNKSLLTGYVFKDSVLFNTTIISIEENSEKWTWVLKKLENNIILNPLWFSVDNSESTSLPDNIKRGSFISSDGTLVNRTDLMQTEKNEKLDFLHFISWYNNYVYVMVDSKSIDKKEPLKPGDNILVKIVSYDENGYVCHYYSKGVSGTQEYRIKR